jgi:hypothetical protein
MSLANNKTIIELYGIPGGGKSTLARTIAAEHGFTHITALGVARLEYLTLFYHYTYTVLLWLPLIIRNYFKVKSIKHLRYNISLLFVSLKKIHLAQKSSEQKLIIDEGLIQRFLSYSDLVLTDREIIRLLSASPLGTVLLLVNNRQVDQDRYDEAHDRGSLGLKRLENWRQNMAQNISKITVILQSQKSAPFFETKTSPVSDILQQINKTSV